MEKLPEFILNHPILFAALAGVVMFIIVTEIRRKTGTRGVSAKEAVRLINEQDAVVVDIRDAAEYKTGHILNAKHIANARLIEESGRISSDKQKPVIVYCKAGTISPAACAKLQAQGFTQAHFLKNGVYGWLEDNLPLEK